jgi:hypothetical protein
VTPSTPPVSSVSSASSVSSFSTRYPSVQIFSILFGIVYLTCFYMDWAPFRYYPDTNAFHLTVHREAGPAILWYGWVTAAALVSAAIAFAVPRRLAERLGPTWAWIVPLVTVIGILIYEKRWFV